jgi:hypothetical protein
VLVAASGVVVVPVRLATVVMLMMRMLMSGRFRVIAMPVMTATAVALRALHRAHQRDGKQRQKNGGKEQAYTRHYRKEVCVGRAAAELALKRRRGEGRGGARGMCSGSGSGWGVVWRRECMWEVP